MHSTFYHVPLRDMFLRRVLLNMPKIKPEDFKQEPQDQTLPESPQIPPMTPPTPQPTEQQIIYSKRRKRPRAEPKLDIASPKMEKKKANTLKVVKPVEHAVVRNKVEEMQWVPVPASSSKEQVFIHLTFLI